MVNLALAVSALPFFGEDVVVPEVEDALVPEIMFHEDMDFTPTSDHGPKQPDNSGVTAYSSDGKTEAPFTDAPGDSTANPAEKAIKQVYEGCLEQGHKMVAEHKIQIEKQLESNNKNLKKIFEQEQAMCAKFDDNADACTKSVVVQARSEQAKFHKQAKAQLKMAQEDFEKHHALCHKHAEDLTGNAQECQANFAAEVKKQQTDLSKPSPHAHLSDDVVRRWWMLNLVSLCLTLYFCFHSEIHERGPQEYAGRAQCTCRGRNGQVWRRRRMQTQCR